MQSATAVYSLLLWIPYGYAPPSSSLSRKTLMSPLQSLHSTQSSISLDGVQSPLTDFDLPHGSVNVILLLM